MYIFKFRVATSLWIRIHIPLNQDICLENDVTFWVLKVVISVFIYALHGSMND